MNKVALSKRQILSALGVVLISIALYFLFNLAYDYTLGGETWKIQHAYSRVKLPDNMHLTEKHDTGDPIDSPSNEGGAYTYVYQGNSDAEKSLIEVSLESQGFKPVQGTDEEFQNAQSKLNLSVNVQASAVNITVTRIQQ